MLKKVNIDYVKKWGNVKNNRGVDVKRRTMAVNEVETKRAIVKLR